MKKLTKGYIPAPVTLPVYKHQKSLSLQLRDAYAADYYESGSLQNYKDVESSSNVKTVRYKDLPQTVLQGYPYSSDFDGNGELQFHFSLNHPTCHELSVGTTGCGKTQCCVEPRIRVLSSKKNKACLFITDPKGELFRDNAEHFKRQGYDIFLLNFKDVLHSDCWNPLSEVYDIYIRQKGLKEQLCHIFGREKLCNYKLGCKISEYGQDFWTYKTTAYATESLAVRCYEDELAEIFSRCADLVHQLSHTLIPDKMQSTNDPSWFMGAQEILEGIIYAMLEDALDERSGFTRDNMNLLTVQDYFDILRTYAVSSGGGAPLIQCKKFKHKTAECCSVKKLRSYFENAPTTTRSYLGCFRNGMQQWFNDKIFTICNGNTVNIDNYEEKPFVIFLITRDSEKSDFTIAGMFIDWVYGKLLEKADAKNGVLSREMYFMLDEFANIPAIKDYENKIATSRSRNIWFHMFIQSYAQIDSVYDVKTAQTIMDNCNSHVFLGSQNYETKFRFSRECGKQTVPSLEAVLCPAVQKMTEVPLLTVGKLESLSLGQMYMRRTGIPLLLTQYVPGFLCEDFKEQKPAIPEEMGIESMPFNADKYSYTYLKSSFDLDAYSKMTLSQTAEYKSTLGFMSSII